MTHSLSQGRMGFPRTTQHELAHFITAHPHPLLCSSWIAGATAAQQIYISILMGRVCQHPITSKPASQSAPCPQWMVVHHVAVRVYSHPLSLIHCAAPNKDAIGWLAAGVGYKLLMSFPPSSGVMLFFAINVFGLFSVDWTPLLWIPLLWIFNAPVSLWPL